MKYSTRMELADRILPELLTAVERHGDAQTRLAGEELRKWDRCADADSKGALLFSLWMSEMGGSPFAKPWNQHHPLETPAGLGDPVKAVGALRAAAAKALKMYGSIDAAYGDYFRYRRDGLDLPGNGAVENFGAFRTIFYDEPGSDGKRQASGGDSYVAVVEFSNPVKARVLLGYGNASRKGSIHRADQLEFMSKKQLREVWRTREEIEKHIEMKELLMYPRAQ
jgi:acyl-homoserine-lactone acylase